MDLLFATAELIPLRGLEGVPGLPGAPQDEAVLARIFHCNHMVPEAGVILTFAHSHILQLTQ